MKGSIPTTIRVTRSKRKREDSETLYQKSTVQPLAEQCSNTSSRRSRKVNTSLKHEARSAEISKLNQSSLSHLHSTSGKIRRLESWVADVSTKKCANVLNPNHNEDDGIGCTSQRSSSYSVNSYFAKLSPTKSAVIRNDENYLHFARGDYQKELETFGTFMRSSATGMTSEDKELCQELLNSPVPLHDGLFEDQSFRKKLSNVRARSVTRMSIDLHHCLVPPVEDLYFDGYDRLDKVAECYDEPWAGLDEFSTTIPRPYRTTGFKHTSFTLDEQRKLAHHLDGSNPKVTENILFPFLIAEAKRGQRGLELAEIANANSMNFVLNSIVEIYQKAGQIEDLNGRVLGFSISHNEDEILIRAHYPEIENGQDTFWQDTIAFYRLEDHKSGYRWSCYRFMVNVCQIFATSLLKRLREVIDKLPDPVGTDTGCASTSVDDSQTSISQEDDDQFGDFASFEGYMRRCESGEAPMVEAIINNRKLCKNTEKSLRMELQDLKDKCSSQDSLIESLWRRIEVEQRMIDAHCRHIELVKEASILGCKEVEANLTIKILELQNMIKEIASKKQ